MSTLSAAIALWYVFISAAAFTLYALDKRAAKRKDRRISERTLHVVAFLGGWPGALLAQRFFRHKTQKRGFRRIFWATVVANATLMSLIVAWIYRVKV